MSKESWSLINKELFQKYREHAKNEIQEIQIEEKDKNEAASSPKVKSQYGLKEGITMIAQSEKLEEANKYIAVARDRIGQLELKGTYEIAGLKNTLEYEKEKLSAKQKENIRQNQDVNWRLDNLKKENPADFEKQMKLLETKKNELANDLTSMQNQNKGLEQLIKTKEEKFAKNLGSLKSQYDDAYEKAGDKFGKDKLVPQSGLPPSGEVESVTASTKSSLPKEKTWQGVAENVKQSQSQSQAQSQSQSQSQSSKSDQNVTPTNSIKAANN